MNRAKSSPEDSLIFMSGSFFGLWLGTAFAAVNPEPADGEILRA
jgi:hypothetical protein